MSTQPIEHLIFTDLEFEKEEHDPQFNHRWESRESKLQKRLIRRYRRQKMRHSRIAARGA